MGRGGERGNEMGGGKERGEGWGKGEEKGGMGLIMLEREGKRGEVWKGGE